MAVESSPAGDDAESLAVIEMDDDRKARLGGLLPSERPGSREDVGKAPASARSSVQWSARSEMFAASAGP